MLFMDDRQIKTLSHTKNPQRHYDLKTNTTLKLKIPSASKVINKHHPLTMALEVIPNPHSQTDDYKSNQVDRIEPPHTLKHVKNLRYPTQISYSLMIECTNLKVDPP